MDVVSTGDAAIECYRSIEGTLANTLKGDVAGEVRLTFCDPTLANFFRYSYLLEQLDVPHVKVVVQEAEGADAFEIDFRVAGKRLQGEMKNAKARFDSGDRSDFLDSELKRRQKFTDGLLAYKDSVRIEFEKCKDGDYYLAVDVRKAIKRYVTETLGIEIVPAIWRDPDDAVGHVRVLNVIMCGGNEHIYQALEAHGDKVFENVLFNFRLAKRKEIYQQVFEQKHTLDLNGEMIGVAIQDKKTKEWL